ncbi:MAG: triphosphoribosyl-dephospho-CoA synthase [Candidatus Lokiarchaeota archaeon]
MIEINNLSIKIQSIEDIIRCSTLSSLLELSGWPKPGNVHRTHDFEDTRFEHFLSAISAIQPSFHKFCKRIFDSVQKFDQNYDLINLGSVYFESVNTMMDWQMGGNVLLGHILILTPLLASTTLCLKFNKLKFKHLKRILLKIIEDSTVEDTINLYKAIRKANPGGLGKVQVLKWLLIHLFSKEYDLISREYATGYQIIFNTGIPYYIEKFKSTKDINVATVDTFLRILSLFPDSLIIRKSNEKNALKISQEASKIIRMGGISKKDGLKATLELDKFIQRRKGKLNPGTTADILAGVIFCSLISGIRF